MFKVMAFYFLVCTQPLSPLINSIVDYVMWYACSCVNKVLLQVAGVADSCLVHVFLH